MTQDRTIYNPEEKNAEPMGEVELAETKESPKSLYSGVLPRFFAAAIDVLLLFIIGMLIIGFGKPLLNWLDIWEWSIGFIIFLAYFAIQNSGLCHGQTIGKRILGIQVVNRQGNYLTIGESLLRAGMYSILFFNDNWVDMNDGVIFSTSLSILSLLVIVATAYLFLFNRPRRQLPHDLIVRSYVVRVGQVPEEVEEKRFKLHGIVLFFISLVLVSGFCLLQFKGATLVQNILAAQLPDINIVQLQKDIEPLINETITQNPYLEKNLRSSQTEVMSYIGNLAETDHQVGIKLFLHWRGPINEAELNKVASPFFNYSTF